MKISGKYLEQISNALNIAIIVHTNADADALGSLITLKRFIKKNFETDTRKIVIDIFSDTVKLDEKLQTLIKNENLNQQTCKRYDLAISMDTPTRLRLGQFDKIFRKAKDTLNIDHHETNEKFAKNNLIASNCSSTCELLYYLFLVRPDAIVSADMYSLIYTGIITDTNNLTQNLGQRTLHVISELMIKAKKENVDLEQIRTFFFKNNTKEQMSLLSRALDSITFSENGKIAMMKINKQDFADTNTTKDDTLGIVDYATRLQGVEVGVIFIKQDDNTYYVSLRSKNDVDVGIIAQQFGGGGHKNVAAFQTKPTDDLTEIKTKLSNLCRVEFDKAQKVDDISNMFVETQGKGPEETTEDKEEENSEKKQTDENESNTTIPKM